MFLLSPVLQEVNISSMRMLSKKTEYTQFCHVVNVVMGSTLLFACHFP